MRHHSQFVINLIASMVNFIVNMGIGFVLTPFITHHVGAEAYGFVGLANNMVNYAALFTIALDSVSGRFVTVAYHQGDKEKADRYFSSTLTTDAVLIGILSAVALPLIANLEHILAISPRLVVDVKWLFLFIYLNFAMSSLSTVLNIATFVKNKLYLSSLANIAYSLVRALSLVICYAIFPTYVLFVGLSTCLGSLVLAGLNWIFTVRLTPELKLRKKAISWKATWHMFTSGIWNTIVKLQQILQDGLSLLIANLAVSPLHMGYLAIAQVVPNALSGLVGTITNLFSPEQMRFFAQHKKQELKRELDDGMRITGLFTNIICVVLLVNGYDFIRLWQHGQNTKIIFILMTLTMTGFFLSGIATTLQGVPLIVNKLRGYSLAWLGSGILSLLLTLLCVRFTPWGIYAVAFVPQLLGIIMNISFVPIYAANCLEIPVRFFYVTYGKYVLSTLVGAAISVGISHLSFLQCKNWGMLLIACCITAIITFVIDLFLLLNHAERRAFVEVIKRGIRHS